MKRTAQTHTHVRLARQATPKPKVSQQGYVSRDVRPRPRDGVFEGAVERDGGEHGQHELFARLLVCEPVDDPDGGDKGKPVAEKGEKSEHHREEFAADGLEKL